MPEPAAHEPCLGVCGVLCKTDSTALLQHTEAGLASMEMFWCHLWQDHPSEALRSLPSLLWRQLPPKATEVVFLSGLSVSEAEKVLEAGF